MLDATKIQKLFHGRKSFCLFFLFPDTFYLIILNLFTLEINAYICE